MKLGCLAVIGIAGLGCAGGAPAAPSESAEPAAAATPGSVPVPAPAKEVERALAVVQEFLDLLTRQEFEKAARKFHLPEDYSGRERSKEISDLTAALGLMSSEFGEPEAFRLVRQPPEVSAVTLRSGTGDYWSRRAEEGAFLEVVLNVRYSREGRGYMAVGLVRFAEPWEIFTVSYALQVSRPGASERTAEIGAKLRALGDRPKR